ncbi:unnamed protein product [Hermetia illucens]|uniref:LanC-like protein 3 homolog n=1 Tax=Hermetia illucens TaxID=343691 RepID=A0A7R8URR9_HERIL|nr:lanC-like protein 3 homolog [Hermetia illucens]CAD7085535.1 unnamed protein product [Hermetia illucens]
MDSRCFQNPYPDYGGEGVNVDKQYILSLIKYYVNAILKNTKVNDDERGDLYVGNAGIAYMFLKMVQSPEVSQLYPALDYALSYINHAKSNALQYKKRADERCAFLCGNAGIYAVSAVISNASGHRDTLEEDLKNFKTGFEACRPMTFSKYGSDEVLVGRAGFLSGCYWLNQQLGPSVIPEDAILDICSSMLYSGREYADKTKAPLPLMYQYHGTEYLGAAHGLCAILHMMLNSAWFKPGADISKTKYSDIRRSIDFYLSLQDKDGNFPVALEDLQTGRAKRLVHWCHGAPGAVYLLAKAYLVFQEEKYLDALRKATDLIWKKGLLRKGPGICHGVAGNGYAFLLMYRLTGEERYLYRALKFMEFLTRDEFKTEARTPDRPYSLYEGVAGTVCYLIDLLNPNSASFPFMEVFI